MDITFRFSQLIPFGQLANQFGQHLAKKTFKKVPRNANRHQMNIYKWYMVLVPCPSWLNYFHRKHHCIGPWLNEPHSQNYTKNVSTNVQGCWYKNMSQVMTHDMGQWEVSEHSNAFLHHTKVQCIPVSWSCEINLTTGITFST